MGTPSSCIRAFKNFSAVCWQWKQMASFKTGLPSQSLATTAQSSSAFATHSRVSFFIENLALAHDFPQKPISFLQSPGKVPRGPHNNIQGKARIDHLANADGL